MIVILKRAFCAIVVTCAVACGEPQCLPGMTGTIGRGCRWPGGAGSGGTGTKPTGGIPFSSLQPGPAGRAAPVLVGSAGMPARVPAMPDDADAGVMMSAVATMPAPYKPVCGNGIPEAGERCDGDFCPSSCATGNACIVGSLVGSGCDVRCEMREITACKSGDGCCAPGCTHAQDSDCSAKCGDGAKDPGETCDGDCPTSCDDRDPCTFDMLTGRADQCSVMCGHIALQAGARDQCCPKGANAANDPDCSTQCGDGVITGGETCDPKAPESCPTKCDDGDPCTADKLMGSASQCNAVCVHTPVTALKGGDQCCPKGGTAVTDSDCAPVCGNRVVEPGETCDGQCPATCEDRDPCTADVMAGTGMECSATCMHAPITAAKSGDGCCPSGQNSTSDGDCKPVCGNGVVESGETCDGNCPASCDDGDPCTNDQTVGSGCNVTCSHAAIGACCRADEDCGAVTSRCVDDANSCDGIIRTPKCVSNKCSTTEARYPNECTTRSVPCGPAYKTQSVQCPRFCGCSSHADCSAGYKCSNTQCVPG